MGYTAGASPKGGPVYNATPQMVADFNANREFTEKLGNRRIGTTAERNDATGKDVWPGLEWYDTTLKRPFTYDGSGWKDGPASFPFKSVITYQGVFKADAAAPAMVYTQNGRAYLDGVVTTNLTNTAALASYTMGSIPEDRAPSVQQVFISNWGDTGLAQVRVTPAGALIVMFFTAPGQVAADVLKIRLSGFSWPIKALL